MSNPNLPVDSTLLQKYAPTIFAAAITLFGGLQVLVSSGYGLVAVLQFTLLIITTVTTFQLTGRWKVGLEVAGVVVTAVLPLAINHEFALTNVLLILVAITKALATHFGVILRGDATVATGLPTVAGPAVFEVQPGEQPSADFEPSTGYEPKHSE